MPILPNPFPYPRGSHVEMIDEKSSASIAAGASMELAAFDVPTGIHRAYITMLGHDIDAAGAWAVSTWRIERNRSPVFPYHDVQDQLGSFDDPTVIGPVIVEPGDHVAVFVANNDAAPHLYAARLRGFTDLDGPS